MGLIKTPYVLQPPFLIPSFVSLANNLASLSQEPLPPENQEGDLHSPSPPIQIPQSHSQQCSRLPSGASLPSLSPFAADPRNTLSKPIFPPSCHLLSPQLFQSIPIPAGHSQHPETSLLRIPTGYSSQGPQKHSLPDNALRPHTSKTQRAQQKPRTRKLTQQRQHLESQSSQTQMPSQQHKNTLSPRKVCLH